MIRKMIKTLKIFFDLKDKVYIKEIDRPGRVVAVLYDEMGLRYKVRYLFNGTLEMLHFFEDELKLINRGT